MKRILILSDTHGFLDKAMLKFVREADEVWHAGDWGTLELALELENNIPLRGVYGNIDGQKIRSMFPAVLEFETEGVKVAMVHIAGSAKRPNDRARSLLQKRPDLFICGHSHILNVSRIDQGSLFINPGAAGRHGFHKMRTMVRLKLDNGRIFDVEVIELGKRGLIDKDEN